MNYLNLTDYKIMYKEFTDSNGFHVFCFVEIEPYDYTLKIINFFETKFTPKFKESKSGWHSTVVEFHLDNVVLTIGDLYDVLCVTLQSPLSEDAIKQVREWVELIDNEIHKRP